MSKIDTRKQSTEVQQHNREQAIRLHLKGLSRADIAEIISVHKSTLSEWIALYNKGGLEALKIGQRGRRTGDGRKLTEAQESKLKETILGKYPDQMSLPFALWSSTAIRSAVETMWGIDMSHRTVCNYMKRWGFTPQKASKRAYERSDKATQEWLEETYPYIKKRAANFNAEVFWGDETGVSNQCQHTRGYAPKGQTPVIKTQAKRLRTNLISAVNNRGKLRFMMYRETMTSRVLIRFMRRLIKDTKRKVFLILDNLRVHHSKLVKAWLEKYKEQIEVFFLPPYTPDLNPDEYLNGDLKQHIKASSPAKTQAQLEKKVLGHLRRIQALPQRVMNYFRHPSIQYASSGI
ncbi:IS630 family transposase [Leucothrix pacifica]|uniref:IS630 family transposase n=1 Tax=Leucothrix pacifica TaxID=1247513 RepID=A0A317CD73_9GAMM|nr:IS630 family transposase [Leucothrix pacifica]PWQ96488.1 IS630 family transposase [Leucothrix pacifica]